MNKQPATIFVESRQQRLDPTLFRTVRVTVIFTTDEYGSTEIHARRVDFDRVDAVVAGLVAKYDVSAKSPHAYQIEHLRALRGAIS